MFCSSCSAPLPPNAIICSYCGTRNEVDLRGIHHYTLHKPESDRICPRCSKPLQTINIKSEETFFIEKCAHCFGFFFDPGELEALLDTSVSNVFEINHNRIDILQRTSQNLEIPTRYLKCPVCQNYMNRVNFGARSGVVVDKCRKHGVWLDAGELRRLMEWVKFGGQILHEKRLSERNYLEKIQKERFPTARSSSYSPWLHKNNDNDLFGLLASAVSKLFF